MFDIITIGSATRDGFFQGINFISLKDKRFKTGQGIGLPLGAKMPVKKVTFTTGGGGVNTAVTFSRQGFKTALISRVADDVSGREVILGQRKEGVYTGFIQIDKKIRTAYSVIFLLPSGERTILSYRGCSDNLTEKEIPWSKIKTKWFFIGPLGGNEKLLKTVINYCRKNKVKIGSTPGQKELQFLKKNTSWLNFYDVFILNQEEASELTDLPYQKEKEIFKKLDQWVKGIVVMTKGPLGAVVSDGKNIYQAGIYPQKKIVDRTGAGDAFSSGFISALMKNPKDMETAIRLGSANATQVVEHIGAVEGILTKYDFQNPRWKNLKMKHFKIKKAF